MGKYQKVAVAPEEFRQYFDYQPEMKHYEIVDSVAKLRKLAAKMERREEFAFDTETNSLRAYGLNSCFLTVCITISWGQYNNYYIPINHRRIEDYGRNVPISKIRKYLGSIFADPTKRIIGHNIKFDMHVLERNGIHITTRDIYDTMIMAWLCDENTPNGLKDCSMMYLGISQQHFNEAVESVPKEVKKEFGLKASSKATFDLVLIDEGAPYALCDAFYTWELYLGFIELIEHEGMLKVYKHNYQPFIRTLFKMEERGTSVDVNKLEEMSKEIDTDVEELKYQMYEVAGIEFNPDSNAQLAELFFGYQPEIVHPSKVKDKEGNSKWRYMSAKEREKALADYEKKLAVQQSSKLLKMSFDFHVLNTTGSGAPSTNGDTFWKITQMSFKNKRKREGVQVANLLLDYKKLSKLKSAFVDGMREQLYDDGKAHPSFNIIGTDSGRISCIEENTLITTVGGQKPIKDMCVGDLVYCYDDLGNIKISPVTKVIDNGVRPCVTVKWKSVGTHKSGYLVCTPDHRIRMRDGTWVEAQNLTRNDRVTHLRRSNEVRPRIYGLNGACEQEQLLIKREYFKSKGFDSVIHHKDENKSNNLIDNLSLMTRKEHTRMHSNELVLQGKIKTEQLHVPHTVLSGSDHPHYMFFTCEELEQMVRDAKGRIVDIPLDFDTFKKKCKEAGFDYKKVASEYQKQYTEVSEEEFLDCYMKNNGVACRVQNELNIGRAKYDQYVEKYNVCFNHSIQWVEPAGSWHVYDLEVADYHNFIASEVCVHNCSSPNLQQLPKADEEDKYQIRSLFIGSFDVPEHSNKRKKIISVDFSNLEMRVLAHFSEDKNLLNMFASGADTHGSTAVNMFNLDCDPSEVKKKYPHLRQAAKVLNFLLMYGGGAQRLYDQLKGDHNSAVDLGSKEYLELYKCKNGLEVAQVYIDKYFDTYSGVAKFIRDQKRFAHKYGYVQTLLQRKRRLPDINSGDMKLRSYCERLAVNSTVQGSAADITSSAQNRVDADPWFVEHRCLMILQVHDELVFECPEEYVEEAIPRIQRYMSHPFGDNVELNLEFKADADSGDSYQDAK